MKKYLKKVPAAILALLLLVSLLPVTALAATDVQVRLPVSVVTKAEEAEDIPADAVYQFKLTAQDGAPMPEEGPYLSVTGAVEAKFSPITYTHAGIYQYTLVMVAGDHNRATYDKTVYNVKVTVTNEGNGLKPQVAIREQGGDDDKKFDSANFVVAYSPLMKDVTVQKVWKGSDTHPLSVQVDLLVGEEVVGTATLNARNNWTYTWEQLVQKRDNSWKVKEKPVRGKFVASYGYNYDKSIATVTNTYTSDLIQTGQLNWPIPVLCSLGTALVVFGLYMIFKKRDDACA